MSAALNTIQQVNYSTPVEEAILDFWSEVEPSVWFRSKDLVPYLRESTSTRSREKTMRNDEYPAEMIIFWIVLAIFTLPSILANCCGH